MTDVLVNFRNGDDPYAAALIYRALRSEFGDSALYRAGDAIPAGTRWADAAWEHHARSSVVVVVVGPRWLTIADGDGQAMLSRQDDRVREEIAAALRQEKLVIPVLLAGARRFAEADLPEDLAPLAALQTLAMDHRHVDDTIRALIERIAPAIAARGPRSPVANPGVWNIPVRGRDLIERDGFLKALREDVSDAGGERPVVLYGGVGTGKTQAVIEYAHKFGDDYRLAWWISAARPELIPAQFAELARAVGFESEEEVRACLPSLFDEVRRHGHWLLVFDGAEDPAALAPYLDAVGPGGDLLITTRSPNRELLQSVRRHTPGFGRAESVQLLREHLKGARGDDLHRLAQTLEDIPLAIAQATAHLADAPTGVVEYTGLIRTRARDLPERGETHVRPASLAAAWSAGLDRLAESSPRAVEVLELLSVFADAPVPFEFLDGRASSSPESAGSSESPDRVSTHSVLFDDPILFADVVWDIADTGLVSTEEAAFHLNAFFQAFIRDGLGTRRVDELRESARRVLARVRRDDPESPDAWQQYALLLPHVFALDLVQSPDPECRRLLLAAVRHLSARSDAGTARALADTAFRTWHAQQGPDDPFVREAASLGGPGLLGDG